MMRWLALLCAVSWLLLGGSARAEERYALLIGANRGQAHEKELRYADADARRLGDVLVRYGGFARSNVVVMSGPTAQDVKEAISRLAERMRGQSEPGSALFFVYYSGHADALAMHLGDAELPWQDMRRLVSDSPANVRLLVIDACRSGHITRVKGARTSKPFRLLPPEPVAQGFAMMSSATSGEDAQESDELQASFFTHHLISGLHGIADTNGDGEVTLSEAYRYTADRTIVSTATTAAGIQHPTYHYELRGRADVVLTRPKGSHGLSKVVFSKPGQYLFHRDSADSPIVLESSVGSKGGQAWIEPGAYFLRWRTPQALYEGTLNVPRQSSIAVESAALREVNYSQYVRKGGAGGSSWSTSLWGGYATPMIDSYAGSPLLGLQVALSLPTMTLEGQLLAERSVLSKPDIDAELFDIELSLGARKVFDVGPVGLSAGLHAGGAFLYQEFDTEREADSRMTFAPMLSSLARVDFFVTEGFFLGAQAELRISWLSLSQDLKESQTDFPVQARFSIGLGKQW